jgi:hypothetical protein
MTIHRVSGLWRIGTDTRDAPPLPTIRPEPRLCAAPGTHPHHPARRGGGGSRKWMLPPDCNYPNSKFLPKFSRAFFHPEVQTFNPPLITPRR